MYNAILVLKTLHNMLCVSEVMMMLAVQNSKKTQVRQMVGILAKPDQFMHRVWRYHKNGEGRVWFHGITKYHDNVDFKFKISIRMVLISKFFLSSNCLLM